MSKIEAGHRKLPRGTVDLQPLLGDLERMFRLRADAKGLAFEIDCAPRACRGTSWATRASCGRFSSTCSATRRSSPSAAASPRGLAVSPAGGTQRLLVEIEDTGPGIAPEELGGALPAVRAGAGGHPRARRHGARPRAEPRARAAHGRRHHASRAALARGASSGSRSPLELGSPPLASRAPGARVEAGRRRSPAATGAARLLVVDDDQDNRTWSAGRCSADRVRGARGA